MKFSNLMLVNKPISMSNRVKNYFRVLEAISSLNCDLEYKYRAGRKDKISDL